MMFHFKMAVENFANGIRALIWGIAGAVQGVLDGVSNALLGISTKVAEGADKVFPSDLAPM